MWIWAHIALEARGIKYLGDLQWTVIFQRFYMAKYLTEIFNLDKPLPTPPPPYPICQQLPVHTPCPSFYSSTWLNPIVPTMWTFMDQLGSLFIYGGILLILEALISNLALEPILPWMPFCGLGRNRIQWVVGVVLFLLMVMAIFTLVVIHIAASSGGKHCCGKIYRMFGTVYIVTYILLAIHNWLSSTHLWRVSREVKSDMAEDHKIQVRTWCHSSLFRAYFCDIRSCRRLRLESACCLWSLHFSSCLFTSFSTHLRESSQLTTLIFCSLSLYF